MSKLAGLVSAAALLFTVACGQTDAGITTAVKSKLAADDMIKAYQVDVDTNNHVVTLQGAVATPAQKEHAVMIARNTDGVTDVIDQLRINPAVGTTGIDDELQQGAGELLDDLRELGDEAEDVIDPSDNR